MFLKINNVLHLLSLTVCFLLLNTSKIYSQTNKYLYEAKVVDSNSNEPIQYASIFFITKFDTLSALSNKLGEFKISLNPLEDYFIEIRAISYVHLSDSLFVQEKENYHLKNTFYLSRNIGTLSSVTVSSNKIKEALGKTIYYVSESDISASVNVSELLSRAPYLTVNNEGKITIKNKQSVQILIDGKPVFDERILLAIPPSLIKKFEIMTNPSAVYDKNKLGGIVNIITKKNWFGSFGNTSVTIGNNQTINSTTSISLKLKKLKANYFIGINNYKRPFNSEVMREDFISGKIYKQIKDGTNRGISPFGNLGIVYSFDSSNEITYSLNLNQSNFKKTNSTKYYSRSQSSNYIEDYVLLTNDKNIFNNIKNYVDFTHIFKSAKSKFSISAWNSISKRDYTNKSTFKYPNNKSLTDIGNMEKFEENIIQSEYSLPLKDDNVFIIGSKFISRKNSADYVLDTFDFIANKFVRDNTITRSNKYKDKQTILSLYSTLSFSLLKKINSEIGFRLENTNSKTNFGNNVNPVSNNYNSFLPSINLLYSVNDSHNFKAGFSKSIQRPSIDYLNPFINYYDPRNLQSGNPNLFPEIYNHVELSYSYTKNNLLFNATPYFDFNRKLIYEVSSIYNIDTLISKYENVGIGNTYGISVYIENKYGKNLRTSLTVNTEKNNIKSSPFSNSGYIISSNINCSYNFPKNIFMRFGFQYATKQVTLQGYDASISSVDFTLRKKYIKSRISVSASVNDFLKINSHRTYTLKTNQFYQSLNTNLHLATFNFRIAFDFGKIKYRSSADTKIDNSDLKKKG